MRKLLSVLLVAILIFGLCGCSDGDESKPESRANTQISYTQGSLEVTEQYDGDEDLIQRIEYNKNSGVTIIYNYSWFRDGWGKTCTDITIVTVSPDGTITSSQ